MKLIKLDPKIRPTYLVALEDHEDFFLVRLQGELGTHALEQNHDKMTAVIETVDLYEKPIVCDFGGVTAADTATLAALITRLSEFRKHGGQRMAFFNVKGELLSLFEISHLTDVFTIRDSQQEAEAALFAS